MTMKTQVVRAFLLFFSLSLFCAAGCSGNTTGEVTPQDAVEEQLDEASPPVDVAPGDGSTKELDAATDEGGLDDESSSCVTGETICLDEATVQSCQNGFFITVQVCGFGMICLDGSCVTQTPCEPGTLNGCFSLAALSVCHESGDGYVAQPCPSGERCLDGECRVMACNPGTRQCDSATSYLQCLPDGSDWGPSTACDQGFQCVGGDCLNGCAGDIKYNQSNVGCEFWSLDLGQWNVREGESGLEPSASTIPHAVVVGNPNDFPVSVTFETGEGTAVNIEDPEVPAGATRAFLMPVMSLQDTEISGKSIRLRTNHPVTAAQFNPPNNEDHVATSDASLLYPPTILGKEYYAVSLGSIIGMEMPMIGKMPSVWGYVSMVAVEPGTTTVTIENLTSATEPGPNFPGYEKGQDIVVELQQWQVFHLQSLAVSMLTTGDDLTGTRVIATQKLAAFAGHDCMVIGDSNCDHLETQLLPVENWGTTYVAGRLYTPAENQYRVISAYDGTTLSTHPSIGGLDGVTLNRGEYVHVTAGGSFEITGSQPIQVIQFIAGNSEGGWTLVDPSMTTLIPVQQFREDYPILVPTAYEQNHITVVRSAGSDVFLNDDPLTGGFEPISGTDWEVGHFPVPEGVSEVTGEDPFGLISYGYAVKVSYAYPGGLNGVLDE